MSPDTLISWDTPSSGASGVISNVLLANVSQAILSLLYVTYNSLITCIFVANLKGWHEEVLISTARRAAYCKIEDDNLNLLNRVILIHRAIVTMFMKILSMHMYANYHEIVTLKVSGSRWA
jgi:hypothetical protein